MLLQCSMTTLMVAYNVLARRKKEIYKLERVQQRATKLIIELSHFGFDRRLLKCGLTTTD